MKGHSYEGKNPSLGNASSEFGAYHCLFTGLPLTNYLTLGKSHYLCFLIDKIGRY